MKLNHINLVVTDVSTAIQFFCTYFEFTCAEVKGDNIVAILKGEDDFTLVLMGDKNNDVNYPKNFHIGFMLTSTAEVDAAYQNLLKDNYAVAEPKNIRDSYGFYFHFENVFIEVGHYL